MGQSADQVRRGEPIRLREGESVVIRPGDPMADRNHEADPDRPLTGQANPAGLGGGGGRTNGNDPGHPPDDPDAIEAGIEQTRAEMSETIDAIQQRLSPENLKEEARGTANELAEHAKEAAREAVQHAVSEAKIAVLDARDAVRGATIGRVEGMARMVGDTTEDARYGIVETIKQNPIPAALAGIGLAWLLMNRQSAPPRPQRRSYLDDRAYGESRVSRGRDFRDQDYDRYDQSRYYRDDRDRYGVASTSGTGATYGGGRYSEQGQDESAGMRERAQEKVGQAKDQAGEMAGRAGDALGQAASQVGDRAGSMMHQAQETSGQLVGQAQHQVQRVEDRVGRAMRDNPLAVGAVALALGTAVGLAVPQTRKENEMFGQARDSLVERAQGLAHETMEKVQEVATETGHTVQREAQAQGLVGR